MKHNEKKEKITVYLRKKMIETICAHFNQTFNEIEVVE